MKGADRYYDAFEGETVQIGKLSIRPGKHARGKTFNLYVIPAGEEAGKSKHAVEVYGITGGQPGWTETYGWLHKGEWQKDFMEIVAAREKRIAERKASGITHKQAMDAEKKDKERRLLMNY